MDRSLIPGPGTARAENAEPERGHLMPEPNTALADARKLKDLVAGRYDEAISYAMPGRDGITKGPDESEIYDDTAVHATPEFASRIQQGIFPNFARWGSFTAGLLVPQEERSELIAALEEIDTYLYEMIGASNFTVEVNEAITDMALGTGALRVDENPSNNPFNARAIPLRSLDFGIGPDGRPDPIAETREVQMSHIKVLWPDATIPPSMLMETGKVKVTEIWQRDWSRPTQWLWRRTVFVAERQDSPLLQDWEEGEAGNPYIVFRWNKASGEGWGRGPLFNALPSMRKVNFAERALLDHTDIALGGIWSVEDDGVINTDTVRLDPGTLVPRAPGSQPLQNVAPAGRFDIAAFVLDNARLSIRKALFTEQLGATSGTPMSATEASHRMAELSRAIGSPFARLIIELVMPVIARCVRILKDRRLIAMPAIDGKEIKLVSTSTLAMSQNYEDIERITQYLSTMAGLYGPESLNVVTDIAETSHKLADLYHVPAGILRSKDDQRTMIQQISEQLSGGQNATANGGAADPAVA